MRKNNNIRIFLSSTFQDLNDERIYLMNIIFPELIRIIRKRIVNLTFVDLRWVISEPEFNNVNITCPNFPKLFDNCHIY
jgi:preprotein translocase subunit SecA/nephrocystin-3